MLSKKTNTVFKISIALNVILISIVAWGYFNTVYVTERVLAVNVAGTLFGLESKIAHQIDNDWSDPSLVNIELEQVLIGISHSQNVGSESNTLSNGDMEILDGLSRSLSNKLYPLETLDSYSEMSEEDKTFFINLRQSLSETGFEAKVIDDFGKWDIGSLMNKFSELTEKNNTK